MRLLLFFDLPTGNKAERRSYSLFHKFLIEDGWYMEQYSVYTRVLLSRESAQARVERVRANLPRAGAVTVMMLTEKQYASREVLVDTRMHLDATGAEGGSQLTLVF